MTFDPLADLFSGLDTQAQSGYASEPATGRGIYALTNYGPKKTDAGYIAVAKLQVVKAPEGSNKKPGDKAEISWFIYKGVKEGGERERGRARDFVNALLGRPQMTPAGQQSAQLASDAQPGRGILIEIEATTKTFTYTKGEKAGQKGTGMEYEYHHIPGQTGETIKAMRERLVPEVTAASVQPTQPAQPADPLAGLFGTR
jgi:hypothetical protein